LRQDEGRSKRGLSGPGRYDVGSRFNASHGLL
jgi:hypothetical protein